jgi:UDP-glucose 4-epimerase
MANLAERVPLERVTLVRGDVTDVPDLVRAIQTHGVDRIIHTAGFLTWMVRERPYAGTRVNLLGTLSVLEAARVTGVQRVVFCSSSTVYLGLDTPPPSGAHREDFTLHAISEYPPSVYASMKLAAEWLCHCYRNEYGVDAVAVRFGGVFGPWHGTPSGGPSQVLQQIVENTYRGLPVRVSAVDLERGGMDYVYAADAAQGTVRAAFAEAPQTRAYNVAMGRLYTVREILDLTEEIVGRPPDLEIIQAGTNSGYNKPGAPTDLSASRQEIGYVPEFPMDEAIRDYAGWLERQAPR